jgi:hypothetical protein
MNNDFRFWIARFVMWALLSVNASIILKIASDTFAKGKLPGVIWFVLVFVTMALGVAAALWYYWLKQRRWSNDPDKSQSQIEVETLGAYAAAEQKQKATEQAKAQGQNTQK